MNAIMRFPSWLSKCFTMSYDDGIVQDVRVVKTLAANGIKATFNLNGSRTKETLGGNLLSRDEIRDLYIPNGMEVAIHGYTHPFLETLDSVALNEEIRRDRIALEEITGTIVRGCAYPFGTYSNKVVEALRSMGIVYSRTAKTTLETEMPEDWLRLPTTCHQFDEKVFDAIDEFKKLSIADSIVAFPCRMLYIWGHSFELHDDKTWEWFDRIVSEISHRDDMWYATNIEIYDYCKAYEQLQSNYNHTVFYNPTAIDVYFVLDGKRYSVKAGETLKI